MIAAAADTLHLHSGAVLAGIAGALVVGLLIGTLHTWQITSIGLPPFIATLASLIGSRRTWRKC